MIRKHDNLNEQKYCYGNHHCPLTSASIIPGCSHWLLRCPWCRWEESAQLRGKRDWVTRAYCVWHGGASVWLLSDGRVPGYSFLCRVRGRTDLFGPAAFPPSGEDRRTFLLALTPLLVPVLIAVQRMRPFQRSLQVWMLSGADLCAESAFPLNLVQHGGVAADPWHLGHLRGGGHALRRFNTA